MVLNPAWRYVPLSESVIILDSLRKPINRKERDARTANKEMDELFPYFGATGQVGYIDDYLIDGEYVLLGEDGAPFLDAFAKKAYIISGRAWVNNHAHILRSKGDNRFLCYYLNHFDFHDYVSGTTRLKLTQEQMKKIPVPALPIEEQRRIVSRIEELFSLLDDAEATLQKTKAQLALYRQAVLKEAFDTIDGTECCIDNVCKEIKVGIVIKPTQYYVDKDGIFAFRNANVRRGYIDDCDWVMISKEGHIKNQKSEVHAGDVLISRSGANLGMASPVPDKYDGYNAIDVVIAVPDKGAIIPAYLAYYTNSPMGRSIVKRNERGAAQGHLNVTAYGRLPIVVPTLSEQQMIIEGIDAKTSVCDSIEQTVDETLQQAKAMRQSILQRVFNE